MMSVEAKAAGDRRSLTIADLRCEGLREAPQVDTPSPRFSWRLVVPVGMNRNVRQTACQLRAVEIDSDGRPLGSVVESLRLETDESQWVPLPGFTAKPRAVYGWQVRVWDNRGELSEWSALQQFGTGVLGGKWPADWIGDGQNLPISQTAPARYFRGSFKIDQTPVRARLYLSALGLVEPWLNGQKVTEDLFCPGWPDYRRRVFYVAFDVTRFLQPGINTLGIILGDGWYSGTLIPGHQFGKQAKFSAFLDLRDAAGRETTIITDSTWKWTDVGPIILNSIYDGETFDARRELGGWCDPVPSSAGPEWHPVIVRHGWYGETLPLSFTARLSPPVRRIQTLPPIVVKRRGSDVHYYDFGQNFAGWVRLKVRAKDGQIIKLRFAEILEDDGSIYTENLRTAKASAIFIAKGAGIEEWEPRFTYFGFRYVELSGVEEPLSDAVTGVVVHSDLRQIGDFECSNPQLNQLWRSTLWGQKSNFLEVPTDCPQRDERAGWTGDAQIFAPTALYNMDAGNFLRQWMFSVRDGFRDDAQGGFPDIAPFTGFYHGSAGWSEAGIIIPWTIWLHTGDRNVLTENLGSIQHALELMAAQAPDGIRRCRDSYGDWLSPGFERGKYPPRQDLVATAYFAYAAEIAARIADVLIRPELAANNRSLRDKSRAAFQREYIDAEGRVADDVQTSYLLTLAFDLAPAALRDRVAGHLVRTIAEKQNHLATGFLGTPLLTPVLTAIGRADVAYTVLQQTTYPSWLYSVKNGATTVWERWDSWTPEQGFHNDGMNSFNHYAYGSVVSWFYDTIVGLQPLPEAPGWKRFRIAPQPGGGLSYAVGKLQTPYGEVRSAWRFESGCLYLSICIPPNTTAQVELPAESTAGITLDGTQLSDCGDADVSSTALGQPIVTLPSGRYEFILSADTLSRSVRAACVLDSQADVSSIRV